MRKRGIFIISIAILIVLIAVTMLSGCKTTTATEVTTATEATAAADETTAAAEATTAASETTAASKPWVHGIADIITTHPFHRIWLDLQPKDIDPTYNVETIFKDANALIDQQISDIDAFIASKPDVLTIVAVDGVAIESSAQKALDAGLLVQAFGVEIKNPNIVNLLLPDYETFSIYANLLAAYLDYKGNICYLSGIKGNSSSDGRENGFLDTIKQYPDIKVLDVKPSDWDVKKGTAIVEEWLNKYDKIDAMVMVDDAVALPAIETIKSFGREDIAVVGYSAEELGLKAVGDGSLLFDAIVSPALFGWSATQMAYLMLHDVDVPMSSKVSAPLVMSQATLDKIKANGVKNVDLDNLNWVTPDQSLTYDKDILPTVYGKDVTDKQYNIK